MKLGKDKVLMAPYMHLDVSAISVQRRIQGRAKIGHGSPHFEKKTCFLAQKATATNRMHSNDLEACGMKFFVFGSIFDSFIVLRWATVALWTYCCVLRLERTSLLDLGVGEGCGATLLWSAIFSEKGFFDIFGLEPPFWTEWWIKVTTRGCTPFKNSKIRLKFSIFGTGSAVPREGFDLSVIILASLLVFPMLGCRHFLLRL